MKMKSKIFMVLSAWVLSAVMAIAGVPGIVTGEVTKISGEMVTIKTAEGKLQSFHVDPKTTKKEGTVGIGAMISADVSEKGHANWVKVMETHGKEKG